MAEALVVMHDVSRVYGRGEAAVRALSGATCKVRPGDRVAVVGPSGSGKSTLLQIAGGLDQPTSGAVSWPALGPAQSLRPRQLGYVFQTRSLLPPLTAVENVELPLLLGAGSRAIARAKAMEALECLELGELADKLPEELSGGQAQRVAVARALATRPRLILADEPTGQLDHPSAQHLFVVLLLAIAQSDTALVVATHDLAIADRMHSRWTMHHGLLEVLT